jgi:UDP-N-acetylglucosamine--N-acetylmuramyl-(pentapeptide) pyrophosphoryl-undecaprenol N-acetylglucosamine transferase
VRRAFVDAARIAAMDPVGLEARSRQVLVTAGSQGARAINQTIPLAFANAGFAQRKIHVLHQTGVSMVEEVRKTYLDAGIQAEVTPFINDMARAYTSASLVIARGGATTLAEMCAIGRPSILIPYPHHTDDHQGKNAQALVNAGAAIMVREHELDADRFAVQVNELLGDRERRRAMADAARALGRPDAAAAIVDDLFSFLGQPALKITEEEQPVIGATSSTNDDSEASSTAHRSRVAAHRRPKVKRCQLRIQTVACSVDATG